MSSASSSVGGEGTSSRTFSFCLTSSCSLFCKTASLDLAARVVFTFVVLLEKEYGVGGDNCGEEGVTGWKIFCGGDNGEVVNVSLGLVLELFGSGGEDDGDSSALFGEGGGDGGRKFELKLFLLFLKHRVLTESRYPQDLVLFC